MLPRKLSAQQCVDILCEGGWHVSHTRIIKHWALRKQNIDQASVEENKLVLISNNFKAVVEGEIFLTHPWNIEIRLPYRYKVRKKGGGFRIDSGTKCTYRFFNENIANQTFSNG